MPSQEARRERLEIRASDRDIEAWARRAQQGDARALDRLLTAVRPRVFRWALVQTAAADEAEDVTQAALLRAQRALPDFNFAARFTTWLYRITRSVVADARRTRQRRDQLLEQHSVPEVIETSEPTLDQNRLIALVQQHFAALPVRQRAVFDLVDLQGHAPAEVAELLALNPATVRVHLLRARRTIRERILQQHSALVEER